jgi:hypothetical protein
LSVLASATLVGAAETARKAQVEAKLPQIGTVIVAGFDSLWIMGTTTKNLVRIRTDDNSVTEIPIDGALDPFWASGMAVGDDAIWVTDPGRSMIYKIDPRTNQVIQEISADIMDGYKNGGKYATAVSEGAVWVITSENGLKRYSTRTGAEKPRFPCLLAALASSWHLATSG